LRYAGIIEELYNADETSAAHNAGVTPAVHRLIDDDARYGNIVRGREALAETKQEEKETKRTKILLSSFSSVKF
jgi:hypothetical protein